MPDLELPQHQPPRQPIETLQQFCQIHAGAIEFFPVFIMGLGY